MKKLVLLLAMAAVMCSCSVYHPQMADVPLITHQGDGHIEAAASLDWMGIPIAMEENISVSYGVTDLVAVQASGSFDMKKSAYGQVAVGVYKTFGLAVLELYGGYGSGYCYSKAGSQGNDKWMQSGNYQVGFGQLDFGWVGLLDGHLDVGIGLKGGVMHPNISEWKDKVDENGETVRTREGLYKDDNILIEPQLMVRTGGEKVKVSVRVGYCELSPAKESGKMVPYTPLSIGVGVNYRF